jgi:hypothetical protein
MLVVRMLEGCTQEDRRQERCKPEFHRSLWVGRELWVDREP